MLYFVCLPATRDKNALLSQIRVSLLASLLAGQITFLAGIDATENKVRNGKVFDVLLISIISKVKS